MALIWAVNGMDSIENNLAATALDCAGNEARKALALDSISFSASTVRLPQGALSIKPPPDGESWRFVTCGWCETQGCEHVYVLPPPIYSDAADYAHDDEGGDFGCPVCGCADMRVCQPVGEGMDMTCAHYDDEVGETIC